MGDNYFCIIVSVVECYWDRVSCDPSRRWYPSIKIKSQGRTRSWTFWQWGVECAEGTALVTRLQGLTANSLHIISFGSLHLHLHLLSGSNNKAGSEVKRRERRIWNLFSMFSMCQLIIVTALPAPTYCYFGNPDDQTKYEFFNNTDSKLLLVWRYR